jgi:hypothetical protein
MGVSGRRNRCSGPRAFQIWIFAFKINFGSVKNAAVLISLLNAILKPKSPIVAVRLEN